MADLDARIQRVLDELEDPYLTEAKEQKLQRRLEKLRGLRAEEKSA